MLKEFKEFAMKGSVMDLAVGVIIGGAFGKIITSFVEDIIMPPIGMLMGKVDFAGLYVNLSGTTYPSLDAAKKAGAATINYGAFLNTLVNFVIIAIVIFLMIKAMNKSRRQAEEAPIAPPTPSGQEVLLAEIRDLLKEHSAPPSVGKTL